MTTEYFDSATGTLDVSKHWSFSPKQWEIISLPGTKKLAVGGIRSGKTSGALMYGIISYLLSYPGCAMLVLRRTFGELEQGAIADFKEFVPKELYKYNDSKHIATFINGSRLVFGHCHNNNEKDINQYLGTGYSFILVDECAQFSPEAWSLLTTRNTNAYASLKPNAAGELPVPCIFGCTNPIGPFWDYYHTVFAKKEPWERPDDAKKDLNEIWFVPDAETGWRVFYNPADHDCVHSTAYDNPHISLKDPGFFERMNKLKPAERDKLLFGLMGEVDGQFYDIFDPVPHTIDYRADPTSIKWQHWQPVWGGWDWGMNHWNTFYWFTKALVRIPATQEYKLKTVCFKEIVDKGKSYQEYVERVVKSARLPGDTRTCQDCKDKGQVNCPHPSFKPSAIYFSHEKFNRQMEAHGPNVELSNLLIQKGLCAVVPSTKDRRASAACIYNELKHGRLVILTSCPDIIKALPTMQINPDDLDDVLKVDSKADDCYDGFRHGVFGHLNPRGTPPRVKMMEDAAKIQDPLARHWYVRKKEAEIDSQSDSFVPKTAEAWELN